MSAHRYPCRAQPPTLLPSIIAGHQHSCVDDAVASHRHEVVEHRCSCGMTWTETVEATDGGVRLLDIPIDGEKLMHDTTRLWAAIHPAYVHTLSWVVHPDHLDAMRTATAKMHIDPIALTPPGVQLQLFGMPIRTDEYAMIPMLELR